MLQVNEEFKQDGSLVNIYLCLLWIKVWLFYALSVSVWVCGFVCLCQTEKEGSLYLCFFNQLNLTEV